MVYAGLSPVNATVQTLRLQMIYIAALVLAAVVLLTMIMNSHIANPLVKINEAAKHLPEGSYDSDTRNEVRRPMKTLRSLSMKATG
jgi:nitrogen fixation/metabolism regulation signal transduction histidine kinase